MSLFKNLDKRFDHFKHNRFNPSVNEWVNSIYSFGLGLDKKNYNLLYNKLSYVLINAYFNMKFHIRKKTIYKKKLYNRLSYLSLNRIFVSFPEFKHSLQNLNILIYIFNKEELLLIKDIKRLNATYKSKTLNYEKTTLKAKLNTTNKFICSGRVQDAPKKDNNFGLKSTPAVKLTLPLSGKFRAGLLVKNKGLGTLKIRYYRLFLYKNYLARLYFNKFMFNHNSLFYLKKILYGIYKTKINISIVNLKCLHLDNSIYVDAITRKLRDRNNRVLKVLKNALIFPIIPTIDHSLLTNKKTVAKFITLKDQSPQESTLKSYLLLAHLKNIISIKKSIYENMKNIHLIGVRLEGKGRLTRRLTASRALYKKIYLGNFKNIVSSFQGFSSVINRGFQGSNINYVNMNSHNRNGSFGIKSWHNTM